MALACIGRNLAWPRIVSVAALLVSAMVFGPASAAAEETPVPGSAGRADGGGLSWSLGLLSGMAKPASRLADYQWVTSARSAWGLQALAGTRRLSLGVRTWNTGTEQTIGASGTPDVVSVRATSLEVIGRGRLATFAGNSLLATASAGRLHLGWDPERITIEQSGGPIVVELNSIDEWIGGAGLALERRVLGIWKVGFEVERRFFALDTAHRDGEAIVARRETVGDWNARVELARLAASR